MPNTACFSGPPFSIVGASYYSNNEVLFEVSFDDLTDEQQVLAYEWYFDNTLLIDRNQKDINEKIDCGNHSIGVRILTDTGWSGVKKFNFRTCVTPVSLTIQGVDNVNGGNTAEYHVIGLFSDGSTVDFTAQYTFTSTAGGYFTGNIFHAEVDTTGYGFKNVILTATKSGETPITKQIVVKNIVANYPTVLVVDFYYDVTLNIMGFVDNPEVYANHIPVHTGQNFVPVGASALNSIMLASDLINSPVSKWRIEFNLDKLTQLYPTIEDFIFYIKGRGSVAGNLQGSYNIKASPAQISMTGGPGSYAPTAVGGSMIGGFVNFYPSIKGGANGSYNEADLATILRFNYHVPTFTLTYTEAGTIEVNEFDFMAVRYGWGSGDGSDLDVLVGFENNGTAYDGTYVGFGSPSQTVPANITPQSDAALWWAGDNASSAGNEAILIGLKKFMTTFPGSTNIIELGIYAVWYGAPISGNFTVELVTYKGGSMSYVGTDLVNTGGVQVSSDTIRAYTTQRKTAQNPANYYKVGTVKYNKTTKKAVITIL